MNAFTFQMPTKIIFREGAAEELPTLALSLLPPENTRVLLVSSRRNAATPAFLKIAFALQQAGLDCTVYKDATPEPTKEEIDHAAAVLRQFTPGLLIAVGGGSEVTAASVIDDRTHQVKLSVTDQRLIPRYAVIDPYLHVGMPKSVSASTGMDALTHAIEAYVSKNANPISDAYAEKCIQLVGRHLLSAFKDGTNLEARSGMALAAVLGAGAYLNAGLGAVHGISQSVAAVVHTPHGVTNAILLPHVMTLNLPGNPPKFAEIARLLGADTAGQPIESATQSSVTSVKALLTATGLPTSLEALNVNTNQFKEIADSAANYRLLPLNPVPITRSDILSILYHAF